MATKLDPDCLLALLDHQLILLKADVGLIPHDDIPSSPTPPSKNGGLHLDWETALTLVISVWL